MDEKEYREEIDKVVLKTGFGLETDFAAYNAAAERQDWKAAHDLLWNVASGLLIYQDGKMVDTLNLCKDLKAQVERQHQLLGKYEVLAEKIKKLEAAVDRRISGDP
jgi:hypothetical protein